MCACLVANVAGEKRAHEPSGYKPGVTKRDGGLRMCVDYLGSTR